jgi:hypothetical protein
VQPDKGVVLAFQSKRPARQTADGLDMVVVFSTPEATRSALERAEGWAVHLDAAIRLVMFQVVPYPMEIDHPPVPTEFLVQQLWDVIPSGASEFALEVFLCRDVQSALLEILKPASLVILGRSRRWRPPEERLGSALEHRGHMVVLLRSPNGASGEV